jgi:hypothetical protein
MNTIKTLRGNYTMGYTIYYKNGKDFEDTQRRSEFISDVKKVIEAFDVSMYGIKKNFDFNVAEEKLYNTYDENTFDASEACIAFVTENEFLLAGAHEWTCLPVKTVQDNFEFTKTARKSYDVVSKVLYLLMKKHFGGDVSHDGDDSEYLTECYFEGDVKLKDMETTLKLMNRFQLREIAPELMPNDETIRLIETDLKKAGKDVISAKELTFADVLTWAKTKGLTNVKDALIQAQNVESVQATVNDIVVCVDRDKDYFYALVDSVRAKELAITPLTIRPVSFVDYEGDENVGSIQDPDYISKEFVVDVIPNKLNLEDFFMEALENRVTKLKEFRK